MDWSGLLIVFLAVATVVLALFWPRFAPVLSVAVLGGAVTLLISLQFGSTSAKYAWLATLVACSTMMVVVVYNYRQAQRVGLAEDEAPRASAAEVA